MFMWLFFPWPVLRAQRSQCQDSLHSEEPFILANSVKVKSGSPFEGVYLSWRSSCFTIPPFWWNNKFWNFKFMNPWEQEKAVWCWCILPNSMTGQNSFFIVTFISCKGGKTTNSSFVWEAWNTAFPILTPQHWESVSPHSCYTFTSSSCPVQPQLDWCCYSEDQTGNILIIAVCKTWDCK